ncbi:E3 ubiquitin-protein ligase PUB23-like [Arachis hypogaea]|uniref:E3 ubiquitin-protein ligase PUB23-like n=1 Tax=Arachis hypogaea TaxID=3818 RepID=UPI000DECE25C|nr:E3 ubiquitin-protein ligase PUB23-like [Arachis hypogaea]XP_025662091.1 E3 ubiquitin-protein ligase PUB23-like [Arachis hypogaea]QHO25869.1 E3 ubiquitin-protein ligase [Arachis hypogaea]
MDHGIDVPPFFVCPISLEIMKDPVIVSTGITYDRESIEKWLLKNKTCPVTKQTLEILDLTPNHTLRRLIQAWCTLNASHGVERIPTPKPPVNKEQVSKLIKDASSNDQDSSLLSQCLVSLKSMAAESESNRRCIESAGAVEFLASIVVMNHGYDSIEVSSDGDEGFDTKSGVSDEALSILHNLHLSENGLKALLGFKDGIFVDSLTRVLQRGIYESRAYAVFLLKSMSQVANPNQLVNLRNELFVELVQVLKDQISQKASKETLETLIEICPWGRNRIKAVESGAIHVLIELLLDCKEKKPCEMMMMVLDILCQTADGRAELLGHAAGVAVVSKKILRVSTLVNDRAVKILLSIARYSATQSVVQEMLLIGVVAKLCLVLQVDSGNKAKEKAREILKLHSKTWRNSPCLPTNFLSAYPTN